MKRKDKQSIKDFDKDFDTGKVAIDFKTGVITEGLSQVVKLPPMSIPAWLALEIEHLSKIQANSKTSVIRQLLVEAVETRRKVATR
jgi:hypothetical protein